MNKVIDAFVEEALEAKRYNHVLRFRMIELCMNTTQVTDDEVTVMLLNAKGS